MKQLKIYGKDLFKCNQYPCFVLNMGGRKKVFKSLLPVKLFALFS